MIGVLGTFMLYIAAKIYKSPIVKKVMRKSIMGHHFDKTIQYYTGRIIPSPADEHYSVEYVYHGQNYIIVCEDEGSYKEALNYIGKSEYTERCDVIIAAFEKDNEGYKNITDLVKKFQGPEKNFYEGTGFSVKKHCITDNVLYIVDKEFKMYMFQGDDDDLILDSSKSKSMSKFI